MVQNLISNRFKVIDKPKDLPIKSTQKGQFYHDILATLDVIAPTKTIIMTNKDIPTKTVQYFKTYLRTLAKKLTKDYRIEVTEQGENIYVWKR